MTVSLVCLLAGHKFVPAPRAEGEKQYWKCKRCALRRDVSPDHENPIAFGGGGAL